MTATNICFNFEVSGVLPYTGSSVSCSVFSHLSCRTLGPFLQLQYQKSPNAHP